MKNFNCAIGLGLGLLWLNGVYGGIKNRCAINGVVAMTFDDGPSDNTLELLDILKNKQVKVTFHLTTQYLTDPNIQSIIQRIASDGHLIGLRTEPSWDLLSMSDDQIKASVARQANVLAQFIGYYPKFIRLPYKKYDARVQAAIESTGAIITAHNLETYDYTDDSSRINKAFQVSLSLAGPGLGSFISIQHDGVKASVDSTPSIIDNIKSMSYRVIKMDECLGLGDMTKNKKPLDGGNGEAAPMEIDGNANAPITPSSSPVEGSGSSTGTNSSSSDGKKKFQPNINIGNKFKGQTSDATSLQSRPILQATMAVVALSLAISLF